MCGINGVFSPEGKDNVAQIAAAGAQMLQNRGPDGAGLVVFAEGDALQGYIGLGDVRTVIPDRGVAHDTMLPHATAALSQDRYGTSGGYEIDTMQPILHGRWGFITNGNIPNAHHVARYFNVPGPLPTDSYYSEATFHAAADQLDIPMQESIARVAPLHEGAYSSVMTDGETMHAWRDPWGWRPLMVGRLASGGIVVSSELPGLKAMGAEYDIRDVKRGEIITMYPDGSMSSTFNIREIEPGGGICGMEFAYLARASGMIEGRDVYEARVEMGRRLGKAFLAKGLEADVVVGIPSSGIYAAIGFMEATGIPNLPGVVLSGNTSGRTFLGKTQDARVQKARDKFEFIPAVLRGKRIVSLDDSMVRGTINGVTAELLYDAGAAEVHVAISSPMVRRPCHFGIRIDSPDELIANKHNGSEKAIADAIGVDSTTFIPRSDFKRAIDARDIPGVTTKIGSICTGCMDGRYPIAIPHKQPASGDPTPLYTSHSLGS